MLMVQLGDLWILILTDYKKANEVVVDRINKVDKHLAEKNEIDDRVYALEKRECFRTIPSVVCLTQQCQRLEKSASKF